MSTKVHKTVKVRVSTRNRNELVEVTELIEQALGREEVKDGIATVFCPHTTAGITIQENADPDVKLDLLTKLSALVPKLEDYYRHAEGNSDSHLKTVMTGNAVQVIVDDGKLLLGRWQGVYLCEFDGPRERELWVKAIGERRTGDRN